MPKKLKTNEDLVKDLMNYSPYGMLCQMLIIEGITRYVNDVAKAEPEDFQKFGAFINPEAWIGCAKDIKQRMDAFYGRSV